MKYKVRFSEENEMIDADYGLSIYDGDGNEYLIQVNPFGEIEITSNDGNLFINPRYANQILIKAKNSF